MNNTLPATQLVALSEFVAARMGLWFPPERWNDLERGLRAAMGEFNFADAAACARWLTSARLTTAQIETLASNLTVGETYFFRERHAFDALATHVIFDLIQRRRGGEQRLRFWCAGCCTGEEPYSLAITLRRTLPDLTGWTATILATDLNPRFLHKAAAGIFGEWSFRDAPEWLKPDYFRPNGEKQYEILPSIRPLVKFEHLNLADDVFPSLANDTNAIDVIFCRNVLLYFTPAKAAEVIAKLQRCLVAGGWLVLGATENSLANATGLVPVQAGEATLFRKPEAVAPLPSVVSQIELPATEPLALAAVAKPDEPTGAAPAKLYAQGRYAEAAQLLTQRPPASAADCALLARCLANQGRLTEALGWCEHALAVDKLNASLHYLRATILQEQGAATEAAAELHRAVYLNTNFVVAHLALGHLARQRSDAAAARRHFEHALRCLRRHGQNDVLPESDGLTAGRLQHILRATLAEESAA